MKQSICPLRRRVRCWGVIIVASGLLLPPGAGCEKQAVTNAPVSNPSLTVGPPPPVGTRRRLPGIPPLRSDESLEAPEWPGDKAALPQVVPKELLSEGWIALFDGLTLFGWRPQGDQNWRVENGAIIVDAGERPALLCTTSRFGDYRLRLEFQADPQTNSGVFLRTPLQPQSPAQDCYEVNIAPQENAFPTASVVGRKKAAAVNAVAADVWRTLELELQGDHLVVQVDGRQVLDYHDDKPLSAGYVGLQHNQGRVAFRNILLKPLGSRPLFNGQDLSGWKRYPEMESEFTVTSQGWLHVQGGSGQLETQDSFGDFILQLECLTLEPRLNSGVFFRCIPGEIMNGYESQIQNGFVPGDRTRTEDFGTGAIFRRRKARLVAADDQQWFAKTIVADGAHFSVWVNGLQVTDWEDQRAPNVNPRQGLRREAGTIILQGHDPATDVSFRKLSISELQ